MCEQLSVWVSQSDESGEGSPSAQDSRNSRENPASFSQLPPEAAFPCPAFPLLLQTGMNIHAGDSSPAVVLT